MNNEEKYKNRYNLRITDAKISKEIRTLSKNYDKPINFIINEILKFGLPIYKKSLTITNEEELNPAENQNYEKILRKLMQLLEQGNLLQSQLVETLEKQAILGANLEVTKHIVASIFSRQTIRDAENPNLRKFSEAEEQIFDTRVPSQFEFQLHEYLKQLFSEDDN